MGVEGEQKVEQERRGVGGGRDRMMNEGEEKGMNNECEKGIGGVKSGKKEGRKGRGEVKS